MTLNGIEDRFDKSTLTYWFVGATFDRNEDQFERFISQGVWENGYENELIDKVNSMKVGDKIAIKSSYVRKNGLPFDSRSNFVSVMAIKAVGTITANRHDGHFVDVDWEVFKKPREWYFYTNRTTLWEVKYESTYAKELIHFTFENQSQNFNFFKNEPYWKNRFGDIIKKEITWAPFLVDLSNQLLAYKQNRAALVAKIKIIAEKQNLSYLLNKELNDICPFTVIGMINRQMTIPNRQAIAADLAKALSLESELPADFDGIPLLNNMKSWFFSFEEFQQPNDIQNLWDFFELSISFADGEDTAQAKQEFIDSYDNLLRQKGIGWNITMALFWIRPWDYVSLDGSSRKFIEEELKVKIPYSGFKKTINGKNYLEIITTLKIIFEKDNSIVKSFPELSIKAYDPNLLEEDENATEALIAEDPKISLKGIIANQCFIREERLDQIVRRIESKKNVIFQGATGTGKTWIAQQLAEYIAGSNKENFIHVQFHPTTSYEDFIRGWRPNSEGKLQLVDGPFLELINRARHNPSQKFVILIEEINRGNPSQIFGEMLTLIENSKRAHQHSLELIYKKDKNEKIYIPDNVYVLGTMNIADRSLAKLDLAFRRRFAFEELEPTFNDVWMKVVADSIEGMALEELQKLRMNIEHLNRVIEDDPRLGKPFCIGHSFFTPMQSSLGIQEWLNDVVDSQIKPLLLDYWPDNALLVDTQCNILKDI
ncbi:McrB family protein [Acinetobacter guillouiae]|uniref:McrB family protein n=1 Tax=Acinetobacter guillouiae TaxID=106649 RepID=UPI0026E34BBF|nr:AAA family ATPase [Acinetobacter guillouiae]MDO6644086.1 AAA family ATPase [Acinetobacter guillouiae]